MTTDGRHRRGMWLIVAGVSLLILGGLLAHFIQTSSAIRVLDVRFAGTNGTAMSALLYVPATASAKTPAPGILAVHGYFNSRETQGGFAIEFARRGYVVLALDQTGHGYSDPPAFANRFGGPDGLAYLRSLDFVDKENIGLEGHSMGGWTVMNAAAAYPNGYKALVLEGSGTGGLPFAPASTATFPRNLAVVFAKFDEFSQAMWGAPTAREVYRAERLQTTFATSEPVKPGQVYGSIADGTGRALYVPAGTHPWNHLSTEAIGYSIDWFQRTLSGGKHLPPDDQIWPWKELGTFLALLGCIVLMLGILDAALSWPYFSALAATPTPDQAPRARWWIALAISILLPILTFFPFFQLAESIAPASRLWPQAFTNQIMVWAVLNALIIALMAFLPGSPRQQFHTNVRRSLVLACLVVGTAYIALAVADFMFKIDFRIWFVGLKLLSRTQLTAFLAYLLPFTVFFVLVLRALHTNLGLRDAKPGLQYAINIAALAGGFVLFIGVQYGLLFSTDRLITFYMSDVLRVIIAIQFIPLMCLVATVSTFAYRRTNSYLPGAFTCALFVTWYVVAGQATHVAG
jgi:pimeloyl-ACP methyl ester carboxylesterase